MSEMCESFHALPAAGGVEDQDPELLWQIITARNARYAVKLMNQGRSGAEELAQHPDLQVLIKAMYDAMGTA